MTIHITAATSIFQPSGDAFFVVTPDTLIVDSDAFLISQDNGQGASLSGGAWSATINGQVAAFGLGADGIFINASVAEVSTFTIGKTGDVFGNHAGLGCAGSLTLTNFGTLAGAFSLLVNGVANITNAGTLIGDVVFLNQADSFTNFKRVGDVIKNGSVFGVIDLWGGNDTFKGGANSETVRDSGGSDSYNLGGGNDTFLALHAAGASADAADTVNGGTGIDTYDASGAVNNIGIRLDLGSTNSVNGGTDTIIGFENAMGGAGSDTIYGSSGANTLIGGSGTDELRGLGGRDILTGDNASNTGGGTDNFLFLKLSDSGTKAASRDLITDFEEGSDIIVLTAIDANTKLAGDQAFHLTAKGGFGGFTGSQGELRFRFTDGGNTLITGDVNGDGVADFSIALKGHHLLHDFDFNL